MTAALRFSVLGCVNTLIGMSTIFVSLRMGLGDIPSNALGYGIGLIFSFFANRAWTFGHGGPIWAAAWRFGLVFAVAYVSNLATTVVLLSFLGDGSFVAHMGGMVPYTILFFFGSRFLVFKQNRSSAADSPSMGLANEP